MTATPIKVLQVVPSLNRSAGVARVVYNWHQFHDEARVHFDYLHHSSRNGVLMHDARYDEELKSAGSNVYSVNYASDDFGRFSREMRQIIRDIGSDYDVVHCHMPNSAFIVLNEAQKNGVEYRILHSHLNSSSDVFLHRLRNIPLNMYGKRFANDYIACSRAAGKFLFGKKDFTVINNGILLDDFRYSDCNRDTLRTQLGIDENDVVIGCVGRFVKQKNYDFAIKLFSAYRALNRRSKLLILGDGDERRFLEELIEEEKLEDSVLLPGVRADVNQLYSVMDVFLMPSLYEGLPVSAIEAQASGLPCIYSDNVPKETDVTGSGTFLPLTAPYEEWVKKIDFYGTQGRLTENIVLLEERGYSAKANAELLMQHYEAMIR